MKRIFTLLSITLVCLLGTANISSAQTCNVSLTDPGTLKFPTLAVSPTNNFRDTNQAVTGEFSGGNPSTLISPIYYYTSPESVIDFRYKLVADSRGQGNNPPKPTIVTSYTITIRYGNPVQTITCTSTTDFEVTETADDFFFSLALPQAFPANLNFEIELLLDIDNAQGGASRIIRAIEFQTDALLAPAGAILPVKFVSLTAKQGTTGTLLTWKVAEEDGVQEYQVERGTNGTNFSRIGSVNASQVSTYTYTDKSSAPVSFYRIKSVDVDGKFGYSTIISLKNGKSIATMKAFPMPAQKQITVQHSMTANNARIMISTGDGRLVKSVIPAVASMQTEVDLSNFQSGLYLLSFEDGNGNAQTLKFIKN